MAKTKKQSGKGGEPPMKVGPAQVAKALQELSNAAVDLSQWALGIRRVVLTLPKGTEMEIPSQPQPRASTILVDYDCPPPVEDGEDGKDGGDKPVTGD